MEQIELKAMFREATGKHSKRVRAEGFVPAVLYGSQIETTPIQIESKVLHRVLSRAGGNTLINLKVGDKKPVPTLAREIQRDVIQHHVIHVDFFQVIMTEKITAEIPLILEGEAPAVKELGGILVQGIDTVQVECLPGDLPPSISIDLSPLANFNDSLTVENLYVGDNIAILSDPDTVVARIEAPRLVEEEVPGEEVLLEEEAVVSVEPELVGRKEEKGEGEEE